MRKKVVILLVFSLIFILSTSVFAKERWHWREISFGPQKTLNIDKPVYLEISHLHPISRVILKPSHYSNTIVVKFKGKIECDCSIEKMDLSLEKESDKVIVKIKTTKRRRHGSEKAYSGSAAVVIKMPEELIKGMSLSSSSADINVSNFLNLSLNQMVIKTDSGEISFDEESTGKINSALVYLKSDSGDISLSSLKGRTLKIKTSSGEVKIENVDVDNCFAKLDSGDFSLKYSTLKSTVVKTGSGNIQISGVKSNILKVSSDSGEITLNINSNIEKLNVSVSSGDINVGIPHGDYHMFVKTDSGDLKVKMRLNNVLLGNNSFEAGLPGQPEIRISSDSGNIAIHWKD